MLRLPASSLDTLDDENVNERAYTYGIDDEALCSQAARTPSDTALTR
ncbi:MAG: hypothetical protein HN667_01540 [Chloroflexi bacterium]|nr:hypothetical protein [Chloroflexota bacterium]MBT5476730.1 hypothetical protein [Chloroflexota bacterium]MBT6707833.1 hypothetical protein [Chloroflexota bacterium]MBT7832303.1 hypothetical protein [Chloroflexota bacterium]